MKALNDCSFIGRLGRDPETKYLPNGTCVTEFSIACDYTYRSNDEDIVETNWIPIVAFGKPAELVGEYARKGNRIFVKGRFKTDRWEDNEGVTKYFTKIYMSDFIVLTTKAENDSKPTRRSFGTTGPAIPASDFDDDIPF